MVRLVFILTIIALSGCCRNAYLNSSAKDSVRYETNIEYVEKVKFDTVFIEVPAQSAEREVRDSVSHLETEFAISDAAIKEGGILFHSLRNKTQRRPVTTPTTSSTQTITRDSVVFRDKVVEVPIEKQLTRWQQISIWTGRIAMIILLIFVGVKIIQARKII